ncbi:aminoglycoside phosphotransferase family protein [Metabacillus indicus]|uniref:aminoglycoside phosphotransferase family protein n=1 Tax=Metabacillus indicus TaxID=246786 RepID=UPI0009DF90F9|nr:aminoglycoside phosphotransferase family protein [Metabacillus indicus]
MMLPETFKQTIRGVHGENGDVWLRELPARLAGWEQKYGIRIGKFYPMTFHFVAEVTLNGGVEAVIKAGLPADKELINEKNALTVFGRGAGVIKLLEVHTDEGFLLLEKAVPGTVLSDSMEDEKAVAAAAAVMGQIRADDWGSMHFPHLAYWFKGLDRAEDIPERYLKKASAIVKELLSEMNHPTLLHGDLHQNNILSHYGEWKAIDPKGVIGEKEFEVTSFCRNNLFSKQKPFDILQTRLSIFEKETGLNLNKMIRWGYCGAVLSACWCKEDHMPCADENLKLADLYEKLL